MAEEDGIDTGDTVINASDSTTDVSPRSLRLPINCARRILENNGIVRVGELVDISREQPWSMRGLGPTKVDNLKRFFWTKGIMRSQNDFPLRAEDYVSWLESIKR